MPNNNRINLQVGFNVDQASVNAVKKSLQDLQNIRPKDFSGTKKELDQIRQMAGKVQTALDRAFNTNIGSLNTQKFTSELSTAKLSVDKIYQTFSKAGAQGQVAFSKMASSVLTTNMQLKQTNGLISQMGQTMMNTVKWGIASSVMNTFTNSVQQAFQYVKSLDSALTDIRIVTGDSTQQMAKFADQANRAASQLGRSTMDYSKAALAFYQQGLDDQAVQARTESVLKAQNITGAGDEMADYLTAVWNGYKVANEQAQLYVDKLAAVADSSASNMSQLAIAMSKVASTANTMGVDVDSLNAQIATIVATTRQAPESVGNALKTIYTRINDIATGADDAQISLGNYSKKMAEVGINVLDTNGRLRDTQDVIEQVGQKWAGMSKEQQIYLARTMAGQRQINNLAALFDNWGKYIDLVDVSMNSQGATMQKNSRYMESLEAHLNQLGAANERLKTAMIDSGSFKGLIDLGTGAVTLFSNLIESIGGGGNALLTFGSIATQVFSGTIAKQLNNIITQFQNVKYNAELVKQDIANTEMFGQSQGYKDGTITAMVDAKKAAQQYYNFMDNAQKNEYNEIVKQIGASQEQVTILNSKIDSANKFKSALKDQLDYVIQEKDQLKSVADMMSSQRGGLQIISSKDSNGDLAYLNQLQTRVNNLKATVDTSAVPAFKNFENAVSNLRNASTITTKELVAVKTAVQQIISETNTGIDLSLGLTQLETDAKQAEASLQLAKKASQDYLNSVKQFANVKGIVDTTAAIGRLASGLNSLKNIGNIWNNQNISSGEKVLQIMTSIGMAIPMLATSYQQLKKITTAWSSALDITGKVQIANIALTNAQIAVQKTSAKVQSTEIAIQKIKNDTSLTQAQRDTQLIAAEGSLALARKAQTDAIAKQAMAQQALNTAMSANPIGLAIAGAAAALYIGVKAYDYFTMSAKEATQAIEAFNQKQEQLNSNLQNFNTDKTNLKVDEWEQLSKRAGAYNSTINNLTEQQKTRYYELSNLIAKYNEDAVVGYDQQGNAIINTNHNLQQTIELLKQKRQLQIDSTYSGKQYNQNVRAQQVQYKNTKKQYQNREASNAIIDSNQQTAFTQNLDYLKQSLQNSGQDYSDLINEINQIQKDGLDNFNKNKDSFILKLNEASSVVPKTAIDYFTNIGDQLKIGKQQQEEISKELQQVANIDFTTLLGRLSTTQNKQLYEAAKQAGALSIDGLIQSYIDGLIESGQVSRDKIGQQEDIYQYIIDEFLNSSEGFLTKLNEVLYTANSKKFSFDQQHNPLNLQQYILQISQSLENQDFSNLKQRQQAIIEKIRQIISLDKDGIGQILSDTSEENSALRQAIIQFLTNAFSLDGIEIDPKFENIKISNDGIDRLKNRIEQSINKGKSEDLKIKIPIDEIETLLPEDITSGEIDALIPTFEELYQVTGDWQQALRKAQQQLNFDSAVESLSLLEAKLAGQSLSDKQLQALQEGLNQIKTLYPQIANSVDILNKQWLEGTIVYRRALQDVKNTLFDSFSNVGQYTGSVMQQMASLITTTEDLQHALRTNQELLSTAEGTAWYSQQLEKIASNYASCTDQLNRYILARQSGNLIDQQAAEFDLVLATRAEENSQLYGIQAERISEVSKQFLEYAQAGREGYQGLQNNAELASDMATRYLRLNDAVSDIIDNFDKYKEVLQEANDYGTESVRANEEMSNTFSNLKESVAGLLDTSTELFGDDWVVQNMNNILEAAQGNEQALKSLQQAAGQQILMNIGVDLSPLGLANEDILNWINQLPDGQIDMTLNDSQFLNQLVWAMQAAGQSQAQIQAALSGLNLDVDLTPYEAGLNAAVDQAYKASDAIVSNLGFDTQAKSETQTDQDSTEIAGYTATPVPMTASVAIPRITEQVTPFGILPSFQGYETGEIHFSGVQVQPNPESMDTSKTTTTTALMVKNARKKSGGNISHSNRKVPGHTGGGKGGKGGKKGGKKASTPKAGTQAKTSHTKLDTKEKQKEYNPYQQVEKSYDRQQKVLKRLEQTQKKITGKQRLKNLKQQVKALQEQNKIIEERQEISKDRGDEGSTANLRKDITKDKVLGADKNLFDEDGQIRDEEAMRNRMVDDFNNDVKTFAADYQKAQAQYNKWIKNTWNKYNKDQQEKYKNQKEKHDQQLKEAKELYDTQVKQAEESYKKRGQLIDNYQKKLEQDIKYQEQYFDNLRTIFDKSLQGLTVQAKINLDAGDAIRTWNQFDNRVLRQIDKNDILGNSKAKAREIKSYIDSNEIKEALDTAKTLRDRLTQVERGGYDIQMGIDHQAWERLSEDQRKQYTAEAKQKIRAQLEQLVKNTEDGLLKVQDLLQDLEDDYVDSLKDAGDKMDDLIDQYERVNSLLDHQIKINELLYGDQAYKYLNKFYEKQRQNNQQELSNLREQQQYWQERLNSYQKDGQIINPEAWQQAKNNLDKVTDDMNSKLQEMMQNAAKVFENKMSKAVDNINNRLTNGLGTKYLEEQWDQIGQFDNYFLDTVNSKFGIQDVTKAYEDAAAAVNDPKQQQRINKLMNDQLKILKEKDKLTEYDIERAKASLQVEKTRMALEDARNNKTKMRLRRDSQGNYTYQYVADQEKLTDLQAALEDAQNNLYNQDKEHYKQNLDQLYKTYKDYIEKMTALETEYNQTRDTNRQRQIREQQEYLKQSAQAMMSGLTEDNKVTLGTYLRESFFDAMDLNLDDYTDEQSLAMVRQYVPWGNSNIQDLSDNLVGEGGLLNATRTFLSDLSTASQQYDTEIKSAMDTFTGTQSKNMQQAINNTNKSLDQQNQKASALKNTYQGLVDVAKDSVEQVAILVDGMQKLLNSNFELNNIGQSLKDLTNTNLNYMGSDARVNTPTAQQQNARFNAITNNPDTTKNDNFTGTNQMYQNWIELDDYFNKQFEKAFALQQQKKLAEKAAQQERLKRQQAEKDAAAAKTKADQQAARQSKIADMDAAMDYYLRRAVTAAQNAKDAGLNSLVNMAKVGIDTGNMDLLKAAAQSINNYYTVNADFPNAVAAQQVVNALLNIPNIAAQKAGIINKG